VKFEQIRQYANLCHNCALVFQCVMEAKPVAMADAKWAHRKSAWRCSWLLLQFA
jgi:hypothetical protein